jgi:hypothetical protein
VGTIFFEQPAAGGAAYDPYSKFLIVRLPQSKQPLVSEFLATLR